MTYKLLSLLDVSIVAFRHDHIFTYTIYISTFRSIYRQAMNFDYASTKPPSECDTNNSLHFHRTVSGSSAYRSAHKEKKVPLTSTIIIAQRKAELAFCFLETIRFSNEFVQLHIPRATHVAVKLRWTNESQRASSCI